MLIHEARGSPEQRSISMKRTIPEIRELIAAFTEESKVLARRQLYISIRSASLGALPRRRAAVPTSVRPSPVAA